MSPLAVLRQLEDFVKRVTEYEFLKQDVKDGFHDASEFINTTRNQYLAKIDREVRDYEPPAALYGGEEGYELYAGLVGQAANHLKPEGVLVLELGYKTAPAVQPLLDTPDWNRASVTNDLAGIPRIVAAERS